MSCALMTHTHNHKHKHTRVSKRDLCTASNQIKSNVLFVQDRHELKRAGL